MREKTDAAEKNALASVAAVGKIVAIDANGIETEDRRRDRRERTPKRPGDAILFLPPVDPSAAEAFCSEIREASGDPNRDRFWLRNGDEFDGELLKIDRRRVWARAFGVEFAVPRGRVRAVRFAENADGKIEFDQVLMVGDKIGTPFVEGAKVVAEVVEQKRADKILVFKKKRRQNYRRTAGHRQFITVLKITDIKA